jgi:hypothetical protein
MRLRRIIPIGLAVSIFLVPLLAQAQSGPAFARDHIYGPGGRVLMTAEPDTIPPTAPTGVSAGVDTYNCQADISWSASTDIGSGVSSYAVYRGANQRGTSTTTSFVDPLPFQGSGYTYTVKAIDAAGNYSAASAGANTGSWRCPSAPRPLLMATWRRGSLNLARPPATYCVLKPQPAEQPGFPRSRGGL